MAALQPGKNYGNIMAFAWTLRYALAQPQPLVISLYPGDPAERAYV